MKLISFRTESGEKIAINPETVAQVTDNGGRSAHIQFADGSTATVEENYETVLGLLQGRASEAISPETASPRSATAHLPYDITVAAFVRTDAEAKTHQIVGEGVTKH